MKSNYFLMCTDNTFFTYYVLHFTSQISFDNLDYSRTEANPPHPYNKVEEVAHEAVVNYRE